MRNLIPLSFLSPFSHWRVERLSSQRVTLKVDVLKPENMLFACTFLHLSALKFYRLRSEGVKEVSSCACALSVLMLASCRHCSGLHRTVLYSNSFIAMISLENEREKERKEKERKEKKKPNLEPLTVSVSFFALLCERIFIETHSIESRCYRSEKSTVCMRVRATFIPKILQSVAVKGLRYQHRSAV